MTDPVTTPLPDAPDRPPTPLQPLVLLAGDDAVVCVDDVCVSPGDEAALAAATESQEPAR